ncbi:hypothetical protein [Paraburkholderia sp. MM5482-R1]|uniref:hypothetical protein n=1 Tax=unclassified Paraburkholderia TaxID=2615204 RepID=UPI003D1A2C79
MSWNFDPPHAAPVGLAVIGVIDLALPVEELAPAVLLTDAQGDRLYAEPMDNVMLGPLENHEEPVVHDSSQGVGKQNLLPDQPQITRTLWTRVSRIRYA